jgi:RHS repeat-associated protein
VLPTGYRWEEIGGDWIEYDDAGRMQGYGDSNNVLVTVSYNPDGRIAGVHDHNGKQVIWYTYDGAGRVVSLRDYSDRSVSYEYSDATRAILGAAIDVRGKRWTYSHDSSGLKSKTDPLGRTIQYSKTHTKMLSSKIYDDNRGVAYRHWDDKSRREFHTDVYEGVGHSVVRGGRKESFVYNRKGVLVRQEINGITVQNVSDSSREKVITDRNGNQTVERYDGNLNLISRTHPDSSTSSWSYKTFSVSVGLTPESRAPMLIAKIVQYTDENGVITKYEYDARANQIREIHSVGRPEERVIEHEYDAFGNVLSVRNIGDANTAEAVSRYSYDESGNVVIAVDPEGAVTQYARDVIGNAITVTDGRGKTWVFDYDASGNLTSAADPLNQAISFEYDGAGNLVKVIDQAMNVWTLEYDIRDNVTKIVNPHGRTVAYSYNIHGQVTGKLDEEEKGIAAGYDQAGRLITRIDGAGNLIRAEYSDGGDRGSGGLSQPTRVSFPSFDREISYDDRNRIARDTFVIDGGQRLETRHTYDPLSRLISTIDPRGNAASYSYDSRGNLASVVDAMGHTVALEYDNRDNLISLRDQKNQITRFEYDRANRLITERRPLGQETTYGYDAEGNLSSIVDPKGQKIEYVYDDAGRMVLERHFNAASDVEARRSISYSYDERGLLVGWSDGERSATFTYDALRRKTGETVSYGEFSLGHQYAYYENGQKKSYTSPGGVTYEYLYDAANRVTSVNIPGQGAVSVNEYTWSEPSLTTLPGGVRNEVSYTGFLEPMSKRLVGADGSLISALEYDYDLNRSIKEIHKDIEVKAYDYDASDRLLSAITTTQAEEQYSYDPVGNRTLSSNNEEWVYNNNNELVSRGKIDYEYDDNGNQTRRSKNGIISNYEYDVRNRLISVRDQAGNAVAKYEYDPFGRRMLKEVNGHVTYFIYSDEGLVAEYDGLGSPMVEYSYWPDSTWGANPLFMKKSTAHFYYQNDHLGTPQEIISASGAIVWAADYQSFGFVSVVGSGIVNNLRFPGQYYDVETGFHYNWMRYYDPEIGRYITSDPIGLRGGPNTYLYASANPLKFIDPVGLLCVYEQSTGKLTCHRDDSGELYLPACYGYAGAGPGLNRPGLQDRKYVGPLPQGDYTVGPNIPKGPGSTGKNVRPLMPDPRNIMFGRDGFYMHGDNERANNTASKGCPIFPPSCRSKIPDGETLRVVPGPQVHGPVMSLPLP